MELLANGRLRRVVAVILIVAAAIALRLWFIIAVRGESYAAMAQNQRLESIEINEFGRGNFLDRDGEPLTNRVESCLVVFPSVVTDRAALQDILGDYIDAEAAAQLESREPFCLRRGLSETEVGSLEELIARNGLSGLYILPLAPRYPQTPLATHIIGLVGMADQAESDELAALGLTADTYVGKSGLERQYDSELQGRGSDLIAVTVDESGRQTTEGLRYIEGDEEPAGGGHDVRLTLDLEYQQFLETAMAERSGAAVLLDVASGDVLAICSSPSYDRYEGQTASDGDVYVNKALSYYPPASVFKLVLVLAALEQGIECPDSFFCGGQITLSGGHTVGCWNRTGHGAEDLMTAVANSCNPYFVALGQQLGGDLIKEYCYKLELTDQRLIGYSAYSEAENISFNSHVPADVANASIGERGIRLTPLQVAQLIASIAGGGKLVTPRLVQAVQTADGTPLRIFESAEPRQVVSAEAAATVRQYMANAMVSGTGSPASSTIVTMAGKTGTTQDQGVWFAGFAPVENPRLAMAVYIDDGESGGKDAGSVFKSVIERIAILEGY